MSRNMLWLAVLAGFGCSGKSYQVANPVVGPAPPRYALADVAAGQSESPEEETVSTVSFEEKVPLEGTAVVARLNGKPLILNEVLEHSPQYAQLQRAREKISPAEYRQVQETLIQRELPQYIEQALMVDAVKSKLKKEQLEAIEKQIDKYFDLHVQEMEKKVNVGSTAELEAMLQQQGMTLESMRQMFGNRTLAEQYVKSKIGEDSTVTRAELLEIYESKKQKAYAQPTRVKWQQLQIMVGPGSSKEAAQEKMAAAQARLKAGASFTEVVKTCSEGPFAQGGGEWDWTQPESIAHPELRKALETLRAGETSGVISSPNSLQIVKILDRQEAGYKPFGDVQEEIRQEIIQERRVAKAKEVIDELMAKAEIEILFETPGTPPQKTPLR
ncbi:peptidylprolyl isomerase [Planctomicrobium sp. SH664]|uniref:peptidylprolyl isomerase n=1 Tax=Planctomicrobium sp. SH664 TaxID=3448125 RepID=UPI003F5C6734